MTRPPLIAPLLGRCPYCTRNFKATVDLRCTPPRSRNTCPWCQRGVELTV